MSPVIEWVPRPKTAKTQATKRDVPACPGRPARRQVFGVRSPTGGRPQGKVRAANRAGQPRTGTSAFRFHFPGSAPDDVRGSPALRVGGLDRRW
jgi:hypothetical protein